MQGVSVIPDANGQPAVLTIDLQRLSPVDSPLVAALLQRIESDQSASGEPHGGPLPYQFAGSLEQERREFLEAAMLNLNRAYGDDEPEYTEADLIWKNPDFKPL